MISEEELAIAEKVLRDAYPEYFKLIASLEVLLDQLRLAYKLPVNDQLVSDCLSLMAALNSCHSDLNQPSMLPVKAHLARDRYCIDKARRQVLEENPRYCDQTILYNEIYNLVVKFSQSGYQEKLKDEASRYGQDFFANMIQPYLDIYQRSQTKTSSANNRGRRPKSTIAAPNLFLPSRTIEKAYTFAVPKVIPNRVFFPGKR